MHSLLKKLRNLNRMYIRKYEKTEHIDGVIDIGDGEPKKE